MKKFILSILFLIPCMLYASAEVDDFSQLPPLATQSEVPEIVEVKHPDQITSPHENIPVTNAPIAKDNSWLSSFLTIATQSDSLVTRLSIVLLIGILMSLTPCIYPMIPITAGILQAQGSTSLLMNFLLALSYTVGIATTFATLGLMAAFAGQAMGSLMTNPFFILPLVALLIYLALSMIGLYDMYTPSFLRPRQQAVSGGSFISAFIFGLISGIVASPCLSPGLICLLCIVTTLQSKFLGFLMLFVFGIGLSIPLLIIGTFSGSLNVLPRAGMWMVEIKKLFGYVMLGMCLYFLNYIVPPFWMALLIISFLIIVALIFFRYATQIHSRLWRLLYITFALACLGGIVLFVFNAYQQYTYAAHNPSYAWHTDYQQAKEEARTQNKKLFVDIGAPFCSICKAIDATLFSNTLVQEALDTAAICVKIDGSDTKNQELLTQYHVLGFPTVLLLNPDDGTVIKKWGPELYGMEPQNFINELAVNANPEKILNNIAEVRTAQEDAELLQLI